MKNRTSYEIGVHLRRGWKRRLVLEGLWTTKNGWVKPVEHMSDNHLSNTINMILRQADAELGEAILSCLGSACRGEMAQMSMDQQALALSETPTYEFALETRPWLYALLKEAERRGMAFTSSKELEAHRSVFESLSKRLEETNEDR